MHQITANSWKTDPVFQPFYHPTGFIMAASQDFARPHVDDYIRTSKDKLRLLNSAEDFRRTMPEGVLTGDFPGWKGFFRETGAGWVFARGALEAAYKEASRFGVKFVTGDDGAVERLVYSDSGDDVIGAKTADGREHSADHVILCAGAGSDQLLDFEKQLRPTAWTLAHIQLTEAERELWKDLPVLFNVNSGFFIVRLSLPSPRSSHVCTRVTDKSQEPDATGQLKFVDEHPGYCNITDPTSPFPKSIPFAKHQIPLESERAARQFLRETVPQIAERPFVFARICWDADTPDRQFLIDRHPKYKSLVVAVGGSGNGFMMMPAVGIAIKETLEGVLEEKLRYGFRWRPETAVGRNWRDTQDRYGGSGKIGNFQDVREWTSVTSKL
jgi:sarcosine oxidase/L-pipecolate oxidase